MPRTVPRHLTRPAPRGVPRPAPARPRRVRALAGVLALGAAVLLSGCGLRLETDPPSEPVPDATEQVRRDAVDDALALAAAADAATAGADEAVAGVLGVVSSTAADQVAALGGVYDSGLPEPDGATPSPSPSGTSVATDPADVLALLGDAASRARTGARTAADPGLARVVASVAASRAQLTDRLAAALGTEAPAVDAEPDDGFTAGGDADGSGSGDGSAALPSASSGTTGAGTAAPTPSPAGPADALGADLDRDDVLALVLAEDQAGYGFEVAAARLADDQRARARSAAAAHRAAATAWAEAAGVAGTAQDPRRVAYELDGDVSTTEAVLTFAAGLLTDLTAAHADAVLGTDASSTDRTAVVDGLRTSAVEALAWGATPTALPGLPATAPTPAPSPTPTAG